MPSLKTSIHRGSLCGRAGLFRLRNPHPLFLADHIGILCSPTRRQTGTYDSLLYGLQMSPAGFGRMIKRRSSGRNSARTQGAMAGKRLSTWMQRATGAGLKNMNPGTAPENRAGKPPPPKGGPWETALPKTMAHPLLNHGHRRRNILRLQYETAFVFLPGRLFPAGHDSAF